MSSFCHRNLLPFLFLISLILPRLVLASTPPFSCDQSNPISRSHEFCNVKLPISKRVDDIISKLTLVEKITQLGDYSPAVDRLGIPLYKWWSESLHGVAYAGKGIRFDGAIKAATSFPQVILTAASFNPQLWYQIGEAIGTEGRALYNAGQADGLTFWSPNINIFRDPRWGRGQETPGEDPLVSGKYAISYVRGLQGDSFDGKSSNGLKVSACCKHFTAYDLENWKNVTRYIFDAKVSVQDLADTYQPPFRSCIKEARASGVMCSYNRVNGVPMCANYNLLTKTAREEWGFNGYIVSDCDAVGIIHDAQGYANTPEDAVADVLKAGMDVNCGTYVQNHTFYALQQKKISESDINRALHNLFTIRMRLGLFDGNPRNGFYGRVDPTQVCNMRSQTLALDAAHQGIVLLKNSGNLLPLSNSKISSLGVIGPNADTLSLGDYSGPPCVSISPLQAIKNFVKNTKFVNGCENVACGSPKIDEAIELAKSVDQVVMFMGLDVSQETEEHDRYDLVLPGLQEKLIMSVAQAAKRPLILVLLCGGPVDVSFAKNEEKIGGVLWGGYPGEAGGLALADVIFGRHNPGGRLPVTWYPQEFTKIPMTDMRMRPDPATGYPGRTYRFYTGNPVYKFGYGLSYSTHSYKFTSATQTSLYLNKSTTLRSVKNLENTVSFHISELSLEHCETLEFSASVRVSNHGPMDGQHSVLLFLRRENVSGGRPMKQLIGFESLHIKNGEKADVEFGLKPCEHFSRIGEDGRKFIDGGSHFLVVGDEEFELTIMG